MNVMMTLKTHILLLNYFTNHQMIFCFHGVKMIFNCDPIFPRLNIHFPTFIALFPLYFSHSLTFMGILLHGICYDFYFVTAYIYVDKKAPKHMRSSAQALLTLFCQGFGSLLSYILGGTLMDHFFKNEIPQSGLTYDWSGIWELGALMIIVILLLFFFFFNDKHE